MQWEKRIYKSMNSMATELNVSLSVFRMASDRDEIMEKWTMLSTYNIGTVLFIFRIFVYNDNGMVIFFTQI